MSQKRCCVMLSDRRQPLFSLVKGGEIWNISSFRDPLLKQDLWLCWCFCSLHLLVLVHTETKHFKDDTASSPLLSCWRKLCWEFRKTFHFSAAQPASQDLWARPTHQYYFFRDPLMICLWRGFTLYRLEKLNSVTKWISLVVYCWIAAAVCCFYFWWILF